MSADPHHLEHAWLAMAAPTEPEGSLDTSMLSPTAHYTSYVRYENGLSHPAFATSKGRALYKAFAPADAFCERFSDRPALATSLLARHQIIDHLLRVAIESGAVTQVFEVASGLSPRGWRFATMYPHIKYVEGDLPTMTATKRQLLSEHGLERPNHSVVVVNALANAGEDSLIAVAARELAPNGRTAIITEGLVNYFGVEDVSGIWGRIAGCLRSLGGGRYYSDLQLQCDADGAWAAQSIRKLMGLFARGTVPQHFQDPDEAADALHEAGFGRCKLHHPVDFPASLGLPGRNRSRHVLRVTEAVVGEEQEAVPELDLETLLAA